MRLKSFDKKNNKSRIILILSLILLFWPVFTPVQGAPVVKPLNENIIKGINLLYNNQFDQANALFDRQVADDPKDPSGYFYLAMVSWSRLSYGYWNQQDVKEFSKRIDWTIIKAKDQINDGTADSQTYFFLGGALGFKGRLHLMEDKYYQSYQLASEAITALKTSLSLDPENKETLLGLGMFDYYTTRLSGLLKFLTNLFLHRGDREEGLRKLHRAADEAVYSSTEAKSILLHIYLFMEEDFSKALPLAKDLSARFPDNHRFKYLEGWTYLKLGLDKEYKSLLEEMGLKVREATTETQAGFWRREILYLEGSRLLNSAQYADARMKLDEALQDPDAENDPAMIAWPLLKKGLSFDLEQKRETALEYYDQIIKMPNGAGAQILARKHKRSPIQKKDPFLGY